MHTKRKEYRKFNSDSTGQRLYIHMGHAADDYVFKAGHQIGVVLIASDYDYTIRPKAGTKLTVKLSEVTLPIVK